MNMDHRSDLKLLRDAVMSVHPQPFEQCSLTAWHQAVRKLWLTLPDMTRTARIVAYAELLALVGDGHTVLRLQEVAGFTRYPLQFQLCQDGLIITAIDESEQWALGGKVLSLGDWPIPLAYARVRACVSRDNLMGERMGVAEALAIPQVTWFYGLAEPARPLRLGVRGQDGEDRVVKVAVSSSPVIVLHSPAPLANTWTYDASSQMVYVCYAQVRDEPNRSLTAFWTEVFRAAEEYGAEKLIIDMRNNGGGDNRLNRSLVHAILRHDRINQWGQLFVLIGGKTFSAACNAVVELERHTRALFVGEPTGGRPNHYGETNLVHLPDCDATISIASVWWQFSDPFDDRPWVAPDIDAPQLRLDVLTGRDRALLECRQYQPREQRYQEYPLRLSSAQNTWRTQMARWELQWKEDFFHMALSSERSTETENTP
jgi:hypothetical protein